MLHNWSVVWRRWPALADVYCACVQVKCSWFITQIHTPLKTLHTPASWTSQLLALSERSLGRTILVTIVYKHTRAVCLFVTRKNAKMRRQTQNISSIEQAPRSHHLRTCSRYPPCKARSLTLWHNSYLQRSAIFYSLITDRCLINSAPSCPSLPRLATNATLCLLHCSTPRGCVAV